MKTIYFQQRAPPYAAHTIQFYNLEVSQNPHCPRLKYEMPISYDADAGASAS